MKERLSPIFILLAAMLWGTTGTSQALAPASAHPIAIGATRLAVGGLFLFVILLISGKINLKNWPVKTTFFAALSMALYQPFFFSAVTLTGVAVGTVITLASAPVLSGIVEWFVFKKRPATVWWISTFLSAVGCMLLFINDESVYTDPYGILLAIGAGFSFASYTMISEGLVDRFPTVSVVAVVFTLSGLMLAPFLFMFDMTWITEPSGILVSLHLGIFATGVSYLLFARGLRFVPSSTAVSLAFAEPLTATVLGVVIVGERLNDMALVGIILLLVGLGSLIWSSAKDK